MSQLSPPSGSDIYEPEINPRRRALAADLRAAMYGLIIVASVLVALYAYRYFLPEVPDPSGLAMHNRFTPSGALLVHAGFAATALLLGSFQFLHAIRLRWPLVHYAGSQTCSWRSGC